MKNHIEMRSCFMGLGLALLLLLGTGGCTKTVVETHDVIVHDTVTAPTKGPAFVRFISVLPSHYTISLTTSVDGTPVLFDQAASYMVGLYTPIADSTQLALLATFFIPGSTTAYNDTLRLAQLPSHALRTYGLFQFLDPIKGYFVKPTVVDDSMRNIAPPTGYCYVRFINGVPDYPSPIANVYLDLNSDTSFYMTDLAQPIPIAYAEIQNYKLIKSGPLRATVKDPTGNVLYQNTSTTLYDGQYYTLRISGSREDSTDGLTIDAE